jgi:CRP/FNR family cyclic AMP-dependent transcriptional regulator
VALRWARRRKVEALAPVGLFLRLSRADLAAVADLAVPEQFAPGAALTREGRQGGLAYVVITGRCAVQRGGRTVARLGPGSVVGELSLLDRGPRTATVVATEEVEALALAQADFQALLRRSPRVRRGVLEALAGRLRTVDRDLARTG